MRILNIWVRDDLMSGSLYILDSERRSTVNSSPEGSSQKEPRDFDDGANALWTLYGKEAKTHDEARVESVAKDMGGILTFVRI